MNQEFPEGVPFRIEEVPISFGERLTNATQGFFYTLAMAPICLVLAPVAFCRIMFTTKKHIAVAIPPKELTGNGQQPSNPDEPDWKKKHNEMYGDDI